MSNHIRKISLFLLAAVALELSSCGLVTINYDKFMDDNKSPASTDAATESAAATVGPEVTLNIVENDYTEEISENLSKIPDENYDGAVFKITSPDTSSLNPESELDFLSESAAKRNETVGNKHSISIVSSNVDFTVYYEEVSSAVKSGMYYSDLLLVPQEMVSSFAANGLILNLRSLPGLDYSAEYFNQSSVGAAAGGFNSYAIAGHASIYPYSLPAVFFNKDLCNSTGNDPYSLAQSGEWTWDKFFEIGLAASSDEYIFSWGTTELGDAVYESAFVSCGNSMINSGIMQIPTLAFDAESVSGDIDILKKLYNDENTIRVNSDSMKYFADGAGFFQMEKLSAMTALRDSKISWGILPMPKSDPSESYTTLAGSDSLMFACPATVSTPEKTAVILMSLNAASEGIIKDAYISYIQYNYLRDNESANMIDLIIDGTVYDFSYTFGNSYTALANGTFEMIREAAVSGETIDSLMGYRKSGLDSLLSSVFGLSN